ncbi:unnamed protein product, partial [Phaeothamnion confervicola]
DELERRPVPAGVRPTYLPMTELLARAEGEELAAREAAESRQLRGRSAEGESNEVASVVNESAGLTLADLLMNADREGMSLDEIEDGMGLPIVRSPPQMRSGGAGGDVGGGVGGGVGAGSGGVIEEEDEDDDSGEDQSGGEEGFGISRPGSTFNSQSHTVMSAGTAAAALEHDREHEHEHFAAGGRELEGGDEVGTGESGSSLAGQDVASRGGMSAPWGADDGSSGFESNATGPSLPVATPVAVGTAVTGAVVAGAAAAAAFTDSDDSGAEVHLAAVAVAGDEHAAAAACSAATAASAVVPAVPGDASNESAAAVGAMAVAAAGVAAAAATAVAAEEADERVAEQPVL